MLKRPSADLLGDGKGLYLPIGTSSIVCLSSTVQMILCCFPTSIGIAFRLAITESQLGRDHKRSCQTSCPRQKQHQIQTSQPSVLQLGPKKSHGQRSTSALGNLFPSSTASLPSSPHAENFSVQTDSWVSSSCQEPPQSIFRTTSLAGRLSDLPSHPFLRQA